MKYPVIRMAFREISLDNGASISQATIDEHIRCLSKTHDLDAIEEYFGGFSLTALSTFCSGERSHIEKNIIEPGGEIAKKADKMLEEYFDDMGRDEFCKPR